RLYGQESILVRRLEIEHEISRMVASGVGPPVVDATASDFVEVTDGTSAACDNPDVELVASTAPTASDNGGVPAKSGSATGALDTNRKRKFVAMDAGNSGVGPPVVDATASDF